MSEAIDQEAESENHVLMGPCCLDTFKRKATEMVRDDFPPGAIGEMDRNHADLRSAVEAHGLDLEDPKVLVGLYVGLASGLMALDHHIEHAGEELSNQEIVDLLEAVLIVGFWKEVGV